MPNYALVDKTNTVVNVIVWDGITEYTPHDGLSMHLVVGQCEAGWTWDGVSFNPTLAQLKADKISQLMSAPVTSITIVDPTDATKLITLPATPDQFAQGGVVLQIAETVAPNINAFRATLVSSVFGREVLDIFGVAHPMTVTQYRIMMLEYAAVIGSLQGLLTNKINSVVNATTADQVGVIT